MKSSDRRSLQARRAFGVVALVLSIMAAAGCTGYTRDQLDEAIYDRSAKAPGMQLSHQLGLEPADRAA